MNSTASTQLIANICVGLAALIFVVPLQILLFESAGKRNDHGQGVLVGALLLLPMWALLLGALLCVTASGGFDGLRLARGWLYPLVIGAALSMTALSFMVFEFSSHAGFFTRLIGRLPVYVFPLATMLLVATSFHPRLAASVPIGPIKLTWLGCAGLSLALCGGIVGYRLALPAFGRVLSLGQRFSHRGPTDREILAQIATLDPQRDFAQILGRARPVESRVVREAATARLRGHPEFLGALTAALSSREGEHALEFLVGAELSPAEQEGLALPARRALERFIADIPPPNFMSSDRRKQLLRWGRRTFPSVAEKFATTKVDFAGVMPAFEHALRPDDTRRR